MIESLLASPLMTAWEVLMDLVNRCAMVIKPKEPYAEWANWSATSFEPLAELRRSAKVVLLPSTVFENRDAFLAEYAQTLFEIELAAWASNQKLWPPIRNAAVFQEWFEITFHALVVDFFEIELIKEPFG
jgi:hypothetical protein